MTLDIGARITYKSAVDLDPIFDKGERNEKTHPIC